VPIKRFPLLRKRRSASFVSSWTYCLIPIAKWMVSHLLTFFETMKQTEESMHLTVADFDKEFTTAT
jgi:hypothetical protein